MFSHFLVNKINCPLLSEEEIRTWFRCYTRAFCCFAPADTRQIVLRPEHLLLATERFGKMLLIAENFRAKHIHIRNKQGESQNVDCFPQTMNTRKSN